MRTQINVFAPVHLWFVNREKQKHRDRRDRENPSFANYQIFIEYILQVDTHLLFPTFLKAQKEIKTKYPNLYYWGAFVMVGE